MAYQMFTGDYGAALRAPDYSGIERAGQAYGEMYKGLGSALGTGIKSYFKGQEEKQMAENMADNPIVMDVVYAGREAPADRGQKIKDIRGVIRASGGYENFLARIDKAKTEQRLVAQEGRNQKTFQNQQDEINRLKEERAAGLSFIEKLMGRGAPTGAEARALELTGPEQFLELGRRANEKATAAGGMGTLSPTEQNALDYFLQSRRAGAGGGFDPTAFDEAEKIRLQQREAVERTIAGSPAQRTGSPLGATTVPELMRRLGDLTPEEKQAAAPYVMALHKAGLGDREIALRLGLGQGAGQPAGAPKYFWSEAEAGREYDRVAVANGIRPTAEGRAAFVEQAPVISLEKLRADADKQIRGADLVEAREVLRAYRDMTDLFATGNPLAGTGAKEKLARMLQPVGILTEPDIQRYGGSQGLGDRITAALQEIKDGTVDADTEAFIKEVGETLAKRAAENIVEGSQLIAGDLADAYQISMGDVIARTPLDELIAGIPRELLPQPGGGGGAPGGGGGAGVIAVPGGTFTPAGP